jgi:hypothetical protein
MAITTAAGLAGATQSPIFFIKGGVTNEAAGVPFTLFYMGSSPPAAAAPTPGLDGAALTSYAGQLPFSNPASGNTYLADLTVSFSVGGGVNGTLILADRLWHNSGLSVTTTTAQTLSSVTWPARDQNGSTDGVGVMVGIEVSTATTNAGAITNTTMEYTNSSGTGTRTATISSFPATALAGTFIPFELQAGDVGVRSIQSVTLGTSYGGGVIHLVAYRIIARTGNLTGQITPTNISTKTLDGVQLGLPRLYDNTVPFFLSQLSGIPSGGMVALGSISYAQG